MLNFSNQQQIKSRFWTESPLKIEVKFYLSYLFQVWKVSSDLHLVEDQWPQHLKNKKIPTDEARRRNFFCDSLHDLFWVYLLARNCHHEGWSCVCCGKLAAPVIFTWILFRRELRYTTPILEKDKHRLNNILIILGGDMLLSSVIGRKSMISSCTSPFKNRKKPNLDHIEEYQDYISYPNYHWYCSPAMPVYFASIYLNTLQVFEVYHMTL